MEEFLTLALCILNSRYVFVFFLFAFVRHTHKTFFDKLLPSGKSVFAHKEWFSNI